MRNSIDLYIKRYKRNICLCILLIVIMVFLFVLYSFETWWSFFMPMVIVLVFSLAVSEFTCCRKINSILKYIQENNLVGEDNCILFWNKEDCILTENYIFIIRNQIIESFKYEDIIKIQGHDYYKRKGTNHNYGVDFYRDIYITFNNDRTYRLLVYSDSNSGGYIDVIRDIKPILLEKNPNIQKEEDIVEPW